MSRKIIPIKLPRGWAKKPHADELNGIARRIGMQFVARQRGLSTHSQGGSSPSSTALTRTLQVNRLRHQREISAMRVAAKIGFVAAGITGARRHEEIRRVIIQNSALVYGFTKGDRRQVFQKMFNKLHRIPGLESGALRQFLDRFMDALWKLRAGLRN